MPLKPIAAPGWRGSKHPRMIHQPPNSFSASSCSTKLNCLSDPTATCFSAYPCPVPRRLTDYARLRAPSRSASTTSNPNSCFSPFTCGIAQLLNQ